MNVCCGLTITYVLISWNHVISNIGTWYIVHVHICTMYIILMDDATIAVAVRSPVCNDLRLLFRKVELFLPFSRRKSQVYSTTSS